MTTSIIVNSTLRGSPAACHAAWLSVFLVAIASALLATGCKSDSELSDSGSAGQVYTVDFINDSTDGGFVYMYQLDSGADGSGVQSLVWLAEGSNPGTLARLAWRLDYAMFWSTPPASAGDVPQASEFLPCTLSQNNHVTFSRNTFGFLFEDQTSSSTEGITIAQDSTIPAEAASIGTAMAGAAVFAIPAQPNLTTHFLPGPPTYRIAFSSLAIQQGQVIGTPEISPTEVAFPANDSHCTVTLRADNTWRTSYGP